MTTHSPTVSPEFEARQRDYAHLVMRYQRIANLTGASSVKEFLEVHVADALTLLPEIPITAHSLLDVGSGAGLPGIPLAIARPGLSITLCERRRKRVAFLRLATGTLGLASVTIHGGDVRELAGRSAFDVVTARAVAPRAELLVMLSGVVAPGGIILLPQGRADAEYWQTNLPETLTPLRRIDWSPIGSATRSLLLYQKR